MPPLVKQGARDDLEPLTARHKIVLGLVAFTFLLLTFSIVPWGSILKTAPAWIGNVLPTNAILMAGLGIAAVGFNQYLKFMFPLMGIWLVIQLAVFAIGVI